MQDSLSYANAAAQTANKTTDQTAINSVMTRRRLLEVAAFAAAGTALGVGVAAPHVARAELSNALSGNALDSVLGDQGDELGIDSKADANAATSEQIPSAGAGVAQADVSDAAPDAASGLDTYDYMTLFESALEESGIAYSVLNDSSMRVSFTGDVTNNLSQIDVNIEFVINSDNVDDNTCSVYFNSWSIGGISDETLLPAAYEACNTANCQYYWTTFSVANGSIDVCISARVDQNCCASTCLSLLDKMVNITEDAAGIFKSALGTASSYLISGTKG